NRRLRDIVASLTEEQLDTPTGYRQWPIWALVGHTACQRVFWLCDFAGEPGADTTRFTNAGHDCPGDDDLENRLSAAELVEALDASSRIVESCLDRWTLDMLDEELRRPEWGEDWVHTRGSVLQRVFSHDVYHCAELNLTLSADQQIDLWD
ncbi:MAG TPA: DinB family protein, partial [Acidimicrobiia bacterium]